MHGLENVDKTDDTAEVTTPPAPTEESSVGTAKKAPTPQSTHMSGPTVTEPRAEVDILPLPSSPPSPVGGVGNDPVAHTTPQVRTEVPSTSYVLPAVSLPHPQSEARRSVSLAPPSDFREHRYRVPRTFRFDVDLLGLWM